MQKTITTVVDPIVSALVGNEIFLISPRTSVINSTTDAHSFLNTVSLSAPRRPAWRPARPPALRMILYGRRSRLAGALGFEPRLSVLETDVLAIDTMPLFYGAEYQVLSSE